MEIKSKKHFVLVHGLGHGAWCWYKLVTILRSSGHRVSAVDLGGCGFHPGLVEEIKSMSDYVKPLMDLMESLQFDEKVILVGHSYSGLCISLAMENFPQNISVAVFISAYMPNFRNSPSTIMQEYFKTTSPESFMDCKFEFDQDLESSLPVLAYMGPNYMALNLYQHCPTEDLELAKMLVRPNRFFFQDMTKDSLLSEKKYGTVKRVFIICEDDRVMVEKFQRYLIENSPPEEVISIAGADHMVMLSKARELSKILQFDLLSKYC